MSKSYVAEFCFVGPERTLTAFNCAALFSQKRTLMHLAALRALAAQVKSSRSKPWPVHLNALVHAFACVSCYETVPPYRIT